MSCTKRQACLGEWSSSGAGLSSRSTNVLLWSSTAMRWRPPGPRRPRRHPRQKGSQLIASQLPCSPGDTAQHPGATPRRREDKLTRCEPLRLLGAQDTERWDFGHQPCGKEHHVTQGPCTPSTWTAADVPVITPNGP